MGAWWSSDYQCIPMESPQAICDGYDLIRIIQLANSSREGEDFVKASLVGERVYALEAMFGEGGEDWVIVIYRYTSFRFCLTKKGEEDDEGAIILRPIRYQCNYLVSSVDNSMEHVISRFAELFDFGGASKVRFADPQRAIQDVSFPMLYEATMMWINKDMVTKEELDFLAEHFKFINSMFSGAVVPPGYEAFMLRYPVVILVNEGSLSAEDLLKTECEYLQVCNYQTTTTEINRFITYWLEHKLSETVQQVHFKQCVNKQDVFDGLGLLIWDPQRRGRYFRNTGKNARAMNAWEDRGRRECSEYMDLVRDDGIVASVHYDEKDEECEFLVWKENSVRFKI